MSVHAVRAALAGLTVAGLAFAQTPAELFEGPEHGWPGLAAVGSAESQVAWDPDGAGPEGEWLIVAGSFDEAGHVAAANLAAWDGQAWRALGDPDDRVTAVTVHQGELIVAGWFTEIGGTTAQRLARFDGSTWRAMAAPSFSGIVLDADSMPDGRLIVTGSFDSIDGIPAANVAAWDGAAWSALGDGIHELGSDILVEGSDVYVVGGETQFGRPAVDRWTGSGWASLTANLIGRQVNSIESWFGQLIIGGNFRTATSDAFHIARFDGAAWRPLLPGLGSPDRFVDDIEIYDDDIIVAGSFNQIGGQPIEHLARFDGSQWRRLRVDPDGGVNSLRVFGDDLIAVGGFQRFGEMDAFKIARWNGIDWRPMGTGIGRSVLAMQNFDDRLILGGHFTGAGQESASHIVAWDGESFQTLGLGLDGPVEHMTVLGDELVVSGPFTRAGFEFTNDVASWDGNAWRGFGDGPGDTPRAIAVYQGQLYAAGSTLIGRPSSLGIARWNGSGWEPVGTGFRSSVVRAMAVLADRLIVLGEFDGDPYGAIWDGTQWIEIPFDRFDPMPWAAKPYDHPDLGPVLLVTRDGAVSNGLWFFDGENWIPLRSGTAWSTAAYEGGLFLPTDGSGIRPIARLEGSEFSQFVDTLPPWADRFNPTSVAVFDDELYAGFSQFASDEHRSWARWTLNPCRVDLDGDGELTIFDLLAFQNLFQDGNPLADFDGDGEFTIFDFLTFQNEFDLGCD
ncbi:MAG: GC-type dockerin domain-anchored protein [Phycisphaerales bacterium]|jgi:hypothetical protein